MRRTHDLARGEGGCLTGVSSLMGTCAFPGPPRSRTRTLLYPEKGKIVDDHPDRPATLTENLV